MKKPVFVICFLLLLIGCDKSNKSLVIEPTIESFANYIVYEYTHGESSEFIEHYLDNTYMTNLYLINLLRDSYDEISIISSDNNGVLLNCDGAKVRMNITIAGGIISKIQLLEGTMNDAS